MKPEKTTYTEVVLEVHNGEVKGKEEWVDAFQKLEKEDFNNLDINELLGE